MNVRTIEYSVVALGQVDGREREHERVQERAGGGPDEGAHAADDHDDERVQEPLAVLAAGDVPPWEPPTAPPKAARAEPTTNATAKTNWMFTPRADVMCWSSTPARMTMPMRVR